MIIAYPHEPDDEESQPSLNALCHEHGINLWRILPTLRIWDTHEHPKQLNLALFLVACSSDGTRFITREANSKTMPPEFYAYHVKALTWNAGLYRQRKACGDPRARIILGCSKTHLAVSPDGHTLAISDGYSWLELWDTLRGRLNTLLTPESARQREFEHRGFPCDAWEEVYESEIDISCESSFDQLRSACECYPDEMLSKGLSVAKIDEVGYSNLEHSWGHRMNFSPDGSKLLVSGGYYSCVLEVPSGRLLQRIARCQDEGEGVNYLGQLMECTFVAGGKLIMVQGGAPQATWGELSVIEYETRRRLCRLAISHYNDKIGHEVAADGKTLALVTVSRSGAVNILLEDIFSGRETTLSAPEGTAPCHTGQPEKTMLCAFPPQTNARWLATVLRDNSVRIWDLCQSQLTWKRLPHGSEVSGLSWVANGSYILTGTTDGKIHLWDPMEEFKLAEVEIGENIASLVVSSQTDLQPVMVAGSLDYVRVWRVSLTTTTLTTLNGMTTDKAHTGARETITLSAASALECGFLQLLGVIDHFSNDETRLAGCNFEGAALTNAWRI